MIEFKNVTKIYQANGKVALDDISFSIGEGELVALVGPNGAGKSTLVKSLCGILTPSHGEIAVLGYNPIKKRRQLAKDLGVMFGNRSSLWYNIPAIESVYLMKDIYKIDSLTFSERLSAYSETLGVRDILDKPVREMSLGQRIRVELLVTLLHHPKIIILDEPTLGLDIISKNHLRMMLFELTRKEKVTVLLTTHDIKDVEKICDRIILINHGAKLLDEKRQVFLKLVEQNIVIQVPRDQVKLPFSNLLREGNAETMKYVVSRDQQAMLIDELIRADISFQVGKPDLEDFLYEYYY
ncbi:ATP-binding cassette domain-containing protein [Enterococcus sp. S86.2]|uniref:ATP-binding cassette domain-containing protein n=1 Tax=Enterococcus sp. S86.2 TaxID=3031299 RepID=UPI0026EE70D5|nr:ATP-binding cassette domain-containing protein [Enterococcus sp. S86.2]